MSKRRGLGRGLDALLGDAMAQTSPEAHAAASIVELPLEAIRPGRFQPRTLMDPERLNELAASIRVQGLVQPVVVRAIAPNQYELIAGERRWRAAQLAQLRQIPAIVRVVNDQATIAMALIENIQREDLSPIEEAQALQRLIDEFDLTHQGAAEAVGRSRASVSNLLRLLELNPGVRRLLETRKLEMGHARALLSLEPEKQLSVAQQAVQESWSVRDIEAHVRRTLAPPAANRVSGPKREDANVLELQRSLSERLCAPVLIEHAGGRGKLVIRYSSLDELDGILARIQ